MFNFLVFFKSSFKYINLFVGVMLFFNLIFISSCVKDDVKEVLIDHNLYRGVKIEHSEQYGAYFSFDTWKTIDTLAARLAYMSPTGLDTWESQYSDAGFISLRSLFTFNNTNYNESYSRYSDFYSPSEAILFNTGGYIKIAGKMYHDVLSENGDRTAYVIDQHGNKEVFRTIEAPEVIRTEHYESSEFPPTEQEDRVSLRTCLPSSSEQSVFDNYCGQYNRPSSKLTGKLFILSPWFGPKQVYAKTNYFTQSCTASYPYFVNANAESIRNEVSCSITADGQNITLVNASFQNYGSYQLQSLLAQGSNICVGYVICSHKAKPVSKPWMNIWNNRLNW
jgi:hypothetical protein